MHVEGAKKAQMEHTREILDGKLSFLLPNRAFGWN